MQRALRVSHQFILLAPIGLALPVAGCDHTPSSTASAVPTSIAIIAGLNAQVGIAGQPLAKPIMVNVADESGQPVPGATVTWSVSSPIDGTTSAATTSTDVNGDASVTWTLGSIAGTDSLQASVAGGVSVTVTATSTPGPVATISKVSGDGQSVAAGSASQPMVVKAVDVYGNAVAGAATTWVVTGGGTLSATTTATDASGQSEVTLTTGGAGTYSVAATIGVAPPVTFTLTAN